MSTLVNTLVKDISNLQTGSIDYDLQIVVGESPNNKTFEAHSLILRARSPYIKTTLSSTWAKKDNGKLIFNKPNIVPSVFNIILG
jgi:hypothetical protein